MPTYTDPVFIDGSQDDPQLRVQGHTTQTDPLQTWENSAGVKLAQVDSNGQVFIDGSQDVTLLRVQAHSTQNQPLQTWENSAGTALAQVTNDGRLEVGNNAVGGVSAALIEANQGGIVAGSAVKQGIQSCGDISGAINEPLTWSVHELEFGGGDGVSSNHTALSSKIIQSNTGGGSTAELRAGEFKVENNQTLNKAVAVRAEISNASGGNITEAAAFEAVMPSAGTIGTLYGLHIPDLPSGQNHYAIHTGLGPVRFGDSVGIGTVPSARLHVAQEGGPLNPVLENVLSDPNGNTLAFRRARGTLASKTLVNNGDYAGRLSFEAWDGSTYQKAASIEAQVAAVPGANDMPGKLVFSTTPDGGVTPVAAMTINADGSATLHNGLKLSGTGGTGQVLKQTSAGGAITVASLSPSEIPALSASQITGGQLALARGGTNADLSGTGGTGRVLKQSTAGGPITVSLLSANEIPLLDAAAISTGTFDPARIPTLDASKIGSGVLDNARVKWATPSAIGNTTPASAQFTDLTVNTTNSAVIMVQSPSNTSRSIYFQTPGNPAVSRWRVVADVADGYGNVDFAINGFNPNEFQALIIRAATGRVIIPNGLEVYGTLVKPGGTFLIDHPLDPVNRNLIHSFVEGPRPDLIYRGKVQLAMGAAQVNIDAASNMTDGTFEALTRHAEAEVFVQNKTGWAAVRGEVVGGVLHIECQDPASSDTVAWLVVAERADAFMQASELTDAEGHFIVEADKPVPTAEDLKALEPRYDATVDAVQVEAVTSLNGKRGYPLYPEAHGMALPTREVRPLSDKDQVSD